MSQVSLEISVKIGVLKATLVLDVTKLVSVSVRITSAIMFWAVFVNLALKVMHLSL